jgi:WW domain-containing oxidoreductase
LEYIEVHLEGDKNIQLPIRTMIGIFKRHKVVSSILIGYTTLYVGLKWIKPYMYMTPLGYTSNTTAEEIAKNVNLENTTALITGASTGIGEETARVLHNRGARLVLTGRNMSKLEEVKKKLMTQNPKAKIDLFQLDLGSSKSVNSFVSEFEKLAIPLNLLILNAGVLTDKFERNVDGIEEHFGTNHLGNFRLTNSLLPTMSASKGEKRIIVVASKLHETCPSIHWNDVGLEHSAKGMYPRYAHSKLAQVMMAKELNRKLKTDGIDITVNSLHPGLITTDITRGLSLSSRIVEWLGTPITFLLNKNIQQGASTTVYAAVSSDLKGIGGLYLEDNSISKANPYSDNLEECDKLWELSEKMTGVVYKPNGSYNA